MLESCNAERERVGKDKFPINSRTCEGILSTITETTLQTSVERSHHAPSSYR